jgi:hypothetical protein
VLSRTIKALVFTPNPPTYFPEWWIRSRLIHPTANRTNKMKFLSIKTREVNYSPFNANKLTYNKPARQAQPLSFLPAGTVQKIMSVQSNTKAISRSPLSVVYKIDFGTF